MTKPHVTVAGIHIESSAFTLYISIVNDFIVTHGKELMNRLYRRGEDWAAQVEWIPALHSRALPGGIVGRGTYDAWKAEIPEGPAAVGPLDGLFSDIHGTMGAQGMDDAEGDFTNVTRGVIGPDPMVNALMNLYGNVSQDLFDNCDILTCYRLIPYENVPGPCCHAVYNLGICPLNGQLKPVKALVHAPALPPGKKTSTHVGPAESLYKMIDLIEAMGGILDTAIRVGFAWADQPRCKGVVVVTDDDVELAKEQVERIGQYFQDVHDRFESVTPVASIEEYLAAAEEGPKPLFIPDSGNNPGAGGTGDMTVALMALLAWKPVQEVTLDIIYASIVGPVVTAVAWEAGAGAEVNLEIGGHIDTHEPSPLNVHATAEALAGDPMGGHAAPLRAGGLCSIIMMNRNQYTMYSQFELSDMDITTIDVVIAKIGYLEPNLYETQKGRLMVLTPGGVDQNLIRLGHHKTKYPIFPFDPNMTDPDLNAWVVVP